MRSIWKGHVKISLVTIPVRMYTASSQQSLRFHLLHEECRTRIKQQNYCPSCDRVVPYEELVRAYEYGKGTYVVLTDEDFERARRESTDTLEVLRFVDATQIEPIYYADAHYLGPDGKIATEAFALFRRVMEEEGKAAVAKVVMRNRERLLALRPHDGTIAAYTLHHASEIRSPETIAGLDEVRDADLPEDSLEMARSIIDNLSGEFTIEDYPDEYTEVLTELIQAKAEGEEFTVEAAEEKRKVVNLMDALKRSVDATQSPKKPMARAGKRKSGRKKKAKEA